VDDRIPIRQKSQKLFRQKFFPEKFLAEKNVTDFFFKIRNKKNFENFKEYYFGFFISKKTMILLF
jgi:hypothetical protein